MFRRLASSILKLHKKPSPIFIPNGLASKHNTQLVNNFSITRLITRLKMVDNKYQQSEKAEPKVTTNGDNDLDDEDLELLKSLREAYSSASQESSSKWLNYNKSCYIYLYRGGGEPSNALAAFDLDGTLIKPKSNKRIPKSATDWQFFSVWTKVKLQQALRENQARFVIFTNQNGVGLNIVPLEEIKERIELVVQRLNMPCTVFMAVDKDEFRKPSIGMFRLFHKSFNGSKYIDLEKSFYCGDAVGYPSHSDADIKFAQTLALPFLPPEKFVRGVKPKLVPSANQQQVDSILNVY